MFTSENTEGFTAQELETLNSALAVLIARHPDADEANLSDALNNVWVPGLTAQELVNLVPFGQAKAAPMTIKIYDIVDQDGELIEESLTLAEAAHAVMTSDGREWAIRNGEPGHYTAWARHQTANRDWQPTVFSTYCTDGDEAACAQIEQQIVDAERMAGHYEAVVREARIASAANFAREMLLDADKADLIDAIKAHYNCAEADVDAEGNVWIANPQTGHWLDDQGLIDLYKAVGQAL
jgi:hypothetical protein